MTLSDAPGVIEMGPFCACLIFVAFLLYCVLKTILAYLPKNFEGFDFQPSLWSETDTFFCYIPPKKAMITTIAFQPHKFTKLSDGCKVTKTFIYPVQYHKSPWR